MPRMLFVVIGLLFASLGACGQSVDYPNQIAVKTDIGGGLISLEGWEVAKSEQFQHRLEPSLPVFQGAVIVQSEYPKLKPKKAIRKLAHAEGMRAMKILSITESDTEIVRQIDSDPKATVQMIMLQGKLKGKPARAIGYVWYGRALSAEGEPANSEVHLFMAPTPAFEALGGLAIPGVLWLGATCVEDENMLEDGRLSPKQATQKLARFYDAWGITYITNQMYITMMMGQTMMTNAQTIQNMQSYNNALATCGGGGDCMSMNADGSWSADVQ